MSFAEKTSVPVDRTEAEIKRMVLRYGASEYMSGEKPGHAIVGFRAQDRLIRFELDLQIEDADRTPTGRRRRGQAATLAYDQEVRRRWRALCLVIKAKLESVESGIETFESAFMANIVMPDGKTFGKHAGPAIESAYATGRVPLLLPAFTGGE